MALQSGATLGPYEIVSLLGAGGMGEVYKARDTRLNRTVAIKVLLPDRTSDPTAKQRLEREARAVAALSHPNICPLFDIGQGDGTDFLVMEFLEGETLADRLTKGKLPLDQALQYGIQIADALAAAHKAGIIHRDLKPGNVMLTKSGAKLLDFGLAKPREPAAVTGLTEAATAQPLTGAGTIVGTLQYMAPEQLEGKEADPRTDVFSFGSVLYEMLTGRRAFEGSSQATLIGNILHTDAPSVLTLVPVAPQALDRLVHTCLAKDPDQRWASLHDVALHLRSLTHGDQVESTSGRSAAPRIAIVGGALTVLTLAVIGLRLTGADTSGAPPIAVVRFSVPAPAPLTWTQSVPPIVSPDGRFLAGFASEPDGPLRMFIRPLDSLDAVPVPNTSAGLRGTAVFSPDGRSVAFADGDKLRRVPVGGGPSQVICDLRDIKVLGGVWHRSNTIFLGNDAGPLMRVNTESGVTEAVTRLDASRGEIGHVLPWFMPDGDGYLYLAIGKSPATIFADRLSSPRRVALKEVISPGVYVDPGYLLFLRDDRIRVQRMDQRTFALSGPEQLVEGEAPAYAFWASETGTLGYVSWADSAAGFRGEVSPSNGYLALVDRAGRELAVVSDVGGYQDPRVSPDGTRVVVERFDGQNWGDLWVYDIRRRVGRRVTFDATRESDPAWANGGREVVFTRADLDALTMVRGSGTVVRINADGTGPERVISRARPVEDGPFVLDVSDRNHFALSFVWNNVEGDIHALPLAGGERTVVAGSKFLEMGGRFSPDGRSVAYVSDESGRNEVYVQAFPSAGRKTVVSTGGGYQPSWRGDGREIYYLSPDRTLMSVKVTPGLEPELGAPERLFKAPVAEPHQGRNHYDPLNDGQRFVVHTIKPGPAPSPRHVVVLNWSSTLSR